LFERSLATLSVEKATAVWKKFMDYENKYGDLASAQHVEKRLHEAHPESKPLICTSVIQGTQPPLLHDDG
jgi:hypothetical protein